MTETTREWHRDSEKTYSLVLHLLFTFLIQKIGGIKVIGSRFKTNKKYFTHTTNYENNS